MKIPPFYEIMTDQPTDGRTDGLIYVHIYIIPGKKSASWQPVAVVMGLRRCKAPKNDVKLLKSTQNQRKNSPKRVIFL